MRHHLNEHLLGAGLISPAQPCALRSQRMFEHHQVPLSVAEELVRASYYHGARNPNAVSYGKELDLDANRPARWLAEPFRLFARSEVLCVGKACVRPCQSRGSP